VHRLLCILQLVGHHLFSALWSDRTWDSHSNLLVESAGTAIETTMLSKMASSTTMVEFLTTYR